MKQFFTLLAAVLFTATTVAQVGINTETPDPSAALDIVSTTGGLLVPRMTAAKRGGIKATQGLIIFCTDCASNEGELQVRLTSSWISLHDGGDVNDPPVVGDFYGGGVVFYLLGPLDTGYVEGETHGLVVSMSDVGPSVEWGCFPDDLQNVPNVPASGGVPFGLGAEIGDGISNTNAILLDCPGAPAALAARSLGEDWFLPSINELKKIYDNKTTLEGVSGFIAFSNYYWSSTEYDVNVAWYQGFVVGIQYDFSKSLTYDVRAVRAF